MTFRDQVYLEEQQMIQRLSAMVLRGELVFSDEATALSTDKIAARQEARARLARKILAMVGTHQSQVQPSEMRAGTISPKRVVGKPLVTIRHRQRATTVTFTAMLARLYPVTDFIYASVEVGAGYAEFALTDDPAAGGGTFALSYNGGSSKAKDSPGRIILLPPNALQLPSGSYLPSVRWRQHDLVIRVEHGGSGGKNLSDSSEGRALHVVGSN